MFKVGDEVRVNKTCVFVQYHKKVGIVTEIKSPLSIVTNISNVTFLPSSLTVLPTLKNGDKVKLLVDVCNFKAGTIGRYIGSQFMGLGRGVIQLNIKYHIFYVRKEDVILVSTIKWHKNGWVVDDDGVEWFFNGDRIVCMLDDSIAGGYICNSIEEGIKLLQEIDYIDKEKVL